jgi:hypothetical protein
MHVEEIAADKENKSFELVPRDEVVARSGKTPITATAFARRSLNDCALKNSL